MDQPERPEAAGPDDAEGVDRVERADGRTDDARTALPPKVEAWRRRSAAGAVLTGFALGLQQALEAPRDDPTIMIETSGEPPEDLPVEADFEYGRPRQSVVSIRPWLLNERGSQSSARGSGDESGSADGRAPGGPS